jgi:hypothetical protein
MTTAPTPYLERNPPDPAPLASAYFIRAVSIPRRGPMRVAPWAFLLAIGLTASLLTGAASAGALVEFRNVSERSPARLLGYLARPDTGVSKVLGSHSNDARPYGRRAAWLRRHFRRLCDDRRSVGCTGVCCPYRRQPRPARHHQPLRQRGHRPGVRCLRGAALPVAAGFRHPARVALIGYSMGGSAALYAVDRLMAAQYFQERFRAAIAFYPACAIATAATMTAPTLMCSGSGGSGEAINWHRWLAALFVMLVLAACAHGWPGPLRALLAGEYARQGR